ncbi:hypothetical protein [Empedobacter falsenii]|uniref:DNA-directed RNA polymerase n=1 Tax=Empedobacter falsenii TaxID=343874 RepID=A0AAW7DID4_9FLAO|nr:hypothetical protein [Empedobacter falsenii]MDM1550919.1 hypothetical protein [Empedobacter falsenii]
MGKIYANFNNKIGWKICISGPLFQFLKNNKSLFPSYLNWDDLLLLASKIEYKISKKAVDFAEIPSDEMKHYVRNYSEYVDFLTKIGAIQKRNYSTTLKRCNAYRVNYELFDMNLTEVKDLEVALKPKYFSVGANNCNHLTKWLDGRLEVDYYNYSYSTLSIVEPQNSIREYEKAVLKLLNYRMSLNELSSGYFRASRDPKSDNRLHTNLTNFPSKLRQFITYDGWDIVAYDVKNSQPYFLIVFLEMFEEERIRRIFRKIYNDKGIMSDRISQTLSCKGFQEEYSRIKDLILQGKLYEFLTEIMDFKVKRDEFLVKSYDKEADKNYFKRLDTKRDACKQVFMQILYSPNRRTSKQYKQFEAVFPEFCELLHLLKTSTNRKNSYKKFPKLLQHIEADCILDFVTKNIAKEYPNMPLFTIHDSIATIEAYSDVLYRKMMQYFTEYSRGVIPQVKEEYWGLDYIKKEAV